MEIGFLGKRAITEVPFLLLDFPHVSYHDVLCLNFDRMSWKFSFSIQTRNSPTSASGPPLIQCIIAVHVDVLCYLGPEMSTLNFNKYQEVPYQVLQH